MTHKNKTFDAVKTMRKIRDNLSRRFKGMTFTEQKRAMQAARKPKPARSVAKTNAKRAT
ncbi:MAG: hypothetical protein AAB403_04615 [Planctomycetota bacterium]